MKHRPKTPRQSLFLVGAVLAFAGAGISSAGCSSGNVGGQGAPDEAGTGLIDLPMSLAETGLYVDLVSKKLAPGVRPFAPGPKLWSDGAEKTRFILLPEGSKIDASNPDEWVLPVGTKVWKEFAIKGKRVETRLFQKIGDTDWRRGTFVWTQDSSHAIRNDNGADLIVDGTAYNVPSITQCDECHQGRVDRLLGFDAIGLGSPSAEGMTLAALNAEGRLNPPIAPESVQIPEDETGKAKAALSWLHANCGVSCHSRGFQAEASGTKFFMRLDVKQLSQKQGVKSLDTYATSVMQIVRTPKWDGETRLVPGHSEQSLLYRLAATRGGGDQMPPIASRIVDPEGLKAVKDWIDALPPASLPDAGAPPHDAGGD